MFVQLEIGRHNFEAWKTLEEIRVKSYCGRAVSSRRVACRTLNEEVTKKQETILRTM